MGSSFLIINNDGADAVTGTFNGLAEGASLAFNGNFVTISYSGGDGNDVVILGPLTESVCFSEYTGDSTTDFSSADAQAVRAAVATAAPRAAR